MDHKVSVVLTTFNGETRGYLRECIESVLNQTFISFELILVDDGSTDNTKLLCANYLNDKRVKYVYQDNKGLAASRNTGIKYSSGDFICFLDDDDVWKADKLKKQIDFFIKSSDPALGMVFTALEKIDGKGVNQGIKYIPVEGGIYERIIYEGNIVTGPSSVMVKKAVLEKVGIFDELMRSAEDLDLWARIAKVYNIYSIKEPLVKYRVHFNRITKLSWRRENFYEQFFYFRQLSGDNSFNEHLVYYNLFYRHAIKHFSLGNYKEARSNLFFAWGYKFPGAYLWGIYFLSFFPQLAELLKKVRRKLLKKSFNRECAL